MEAVFYFLLCILLISSFPGLRTRGSVLYSVRIPTLDRLRSKNVEKGRKNSRERSGVFRPFFQYYLK